MFKAIFAAFTKAKERKKIRKVFVKSVALTKIMRFTRNTSAF